MMGWTSRLLPVGFEARGDADLLVFVRDSTRGGAREVDQGFGQGPWAMLTRLQDGVTWWDAFLGAGNRGRPQRIYSACRVKYSKGARGGSECFSSLLCV